MSQWAKQRKFSASSCTIRVVPHLAGPVFSPSRPTDVIDRLILIDIRGSESSGHSLFNDVSKRWIGKTLEEWER
jgi:hypothetical protein